MVAMMKMYWKRTKWKERPVKKPLQLPRKQMVARTGEVEWRQRFVCVQELLWKCHH